MARTTGRSGFKMRSGNSPLRQPESTSEIRKKTLGSEINRFFSDLSEGLRKGAKGHQDWKAKRKEKTNDPTAYKENLARQYRTGEYSASGSKSHLAMKPGESKFQYDVRMRKEGGRVPSAPNPGSTYQTPDPTEITGLTGGPSYGRKTQENPGDLRGEDIRMTHKLPSAPGDDWTYEFSYNPQFDYESEEEYIEPKTSLKFRFA